MATTVHEPPKVEDPAKPKRVADSGNGGWRNLVPADGDLRSVQEYSPPPASTGIGVRLAAIGMSVAAQHPRRYFALLALHGRALGIFAGSALGQDLTEKGR